MNIADELRALADKLDAEVPKLDEHELRNWTDEEISMMVSGTPDLHLRNPSQFDKMKQYADPELEPFTAMSWMRVGMLGPKAAAQRPMKNVTLGGIEYRRMMPSAEPDWYAVGHRGVVDVMADTWLVPVDAKLSNDHAVQAQRAAEYNGGFRKPLSLWPDHMKQAYKGAH